MGATSRAAVVFSRYPAELASRIDEINAWVYPAINNGVYKCGFAKSQEAYSEAFQKLFTAMDRVEEILSKTRFLTGDKLTEADIRLFTTLVRFGEFRACPCHSPQATMLTVCHVFCRCGVLCGSCVRALQRRALCSPRDSDSLTLVVVWCVFLLCVAAFQNQWSPRNRLPEHVGLRARYVRLMAWASLVQDAHCACPRSYQTHGVRETVNMQQIKDHYYRSHTQINPTGIVPDGPFIDFETPHGRESMSTSS